MPSGRPLPDDIWNRRHQMIIIVLWLHVAGLAAFGLLKGEGVLHVLIEVGPIALATSLAMVSTTRRWQATAASTGLVTASAVLVHFSGGFIEAHFHFFVVLAIIMLYQGWIPFLIAIGYVALHHGVVGVLAPTAVYNHPAAVANPWLWAAIHAAFVIAESLAFVASWHLADLQAVHDSVTSLPNRALFFLQVDHALARARLKLCSACVLVVEIADFDAISTNLGRTAADDLLRRVTDRLADSLSADTVCRLGWASFAALNEDARTAKEADGLAARIRYAFHVPLDVDGQVVTLVVKVGVAFSETGATTADSLVQHATATTWATARAA